MPGIKDPAIARAIKLAGGQVGLSERLAKQHISITQQGISYWKIRGYAEPQYHSAISQAVGRRITVKELRDDIK